MSQPEPVQNGVLDLKWERSRRCDTNTCVEVADSPSTSTVSIRNNRVPDGPVVTFPAEDWEVFRTQVLAGRHHF